MMYYSNFCIVHSKAHGVRTSCREKPAVDITAAAFSPSLSLIVTGGEDGSIRVWDFQTLLPAGLAVDSAAALAEQRAKAKKALRAERRSAASKSSGGVDGRVSPSHMTDAEVSVLLLWMLLLLSVLQESESERERGGEKKRERERDRM